MNIDQINMLHSWVNLVLSFIWVVLICGANKKREAAKEKSEQETSLRDAARSIKAARVAFSKKRCDCGQNNRA